MMACASARFMRSMPRSAVWSSSVAWSLFLQVLVDRCFDVVGERRVVGDEARGREPESVDVPGLAGLPGHPGDARVLVEILRGRLSRCIRARVEPASRILGMV